MLERLTKCPLCKSGRFLNSQEIKDYAVSKETFIICKCRSCGLKFTNPRPTAETIGPYYDFPEYYSHEDKVSNFTQLIYQKVRKYSVNQKVKLINRLVPHKGKILDYGCGTAEFLLAANNDTWKVTGIEPNEKARKLGNSKLADQVFESLDEIKAGKQFEVITLFHVLEHVHSLRKTVKKLIKHLKSTGYIIIAVPNYKSFDAKKYGNEWAGWDVPRHLYHFNESALNAFEDIFKLELVEKIPMVFDSYYVSLLSEGYRKPSQNVLAKYLKAFSSGYQSNQLAVKNQANHSSNIFIFKKR
ncbi:class I SAM-dependent methyltransferase [Algoriphagus halophytocola]|uniref:class I SAM-dependent methyltransferase n=1 Tax=Algoriphagus halophytocola TaxID=2991499 RepID=UPI0022DD383C|nr:class I SAM-dependent methyltransferase [Algoriphagus sp. TR-M9]WBL42770.1 class I SAM-dependent methyltransferase [Algoriphagus sp. TR-M9]